MVFYFFFSRYIHLFRMWCDARGYHTIIQRVERKVQLESLASVVCVRLMAFAAMHTQMQGQPHHLFTEKLSHNRCHSGFFFFVPPKQPKTTATQDKHELPF